MTNPRPVSLPPPLVPGNQERRGIVGGMFGLPTIGSAKPNAGDRDFLAEDGLRLTNARSGIVFLVQCLRCRRIWLPSYLCPSIISALRQSGVTILFYPVDNLLGVPDRSWVSSVHEDDLMLIIDYFGFPADNDLVAEVKARKAWVLEDASQALLTQYRLPSADYVLFSPRKFVGVPDGGILVGQNGNGLAAGELARPHPWWLLNLEAMVRRREFDECEVSNDWFGAYQQAKRAAPAGLFRMSELAWELLETAFDYESIASQRVSNYRFLAENLADCALLPEVAPGVVPLGFPIRVEERGAVTRSLYDARIYPAVHWDLHGSVPLQFEASHALSKKILTLPCDQRYNERDMGEMVDLIRSARVS